MVFGKGFTDRELTEEDVRQIVNETLGSMSLAGKKVLAIIPDHSRTAPIDLMFRVVYEAVADQVSQLDFLVALGTHPPMSDEAINTRMGITEAERASKHPKARFFNHHWNDPNALACIGTLSSEEVAELSEGRLHEAVDVTINKMVLDYDQILIIGPVFPHEVVGFSGGGKYLFPGIAGKEIIDMFHWLGALITSSAIIPAVAKAGFRQIACIPILAPVDVACLALVVKGHGLAGLYGGSSREAWAEAARLSEQLHITFKEKPFQSVLSCAPAMYDDLWTGAKCMYKLEPVVADGGELIIYAPHITEVSVTHGEHIEAIGYHVRDYFLKQWDRFSHVPGGVMAHSTHVKGAGTFEDGVETPRIHVTLATGIPEAVCKKINLGYRDPASINPSDWMDKEDEGKLYVPKAGEMLYRVK